MAEAAQLVAEVAPTARGRLGERARLRDLFSRYVGRDVATHALARGVELGGEVREAAILFVDLVGSTRLAEASEPRKVVATLNAFFAIVVEVVGRHGGWVNKFQGDAALCVFGAPVDRPDAGGLALRAARELRARLGAELPAIDAAIGVSAGPVVAGNVGSASRLEYTVIGDAVNEAARLTELAKATPTRLLASGSIVARAGRRESARWRLGESVQLRGKSSPTRLASPSEGPATRSRSERDRRPSPATRQSR